MALRPDLEAKIQAYEKKLDELGQRVEALADDGVAVPAETLDDPSVVRHVNDLERAAKRARSDAGALLRKVASGGYSISRPRAR